MVPTPMEPPSGALVPAPSADTLPPPSPPLSPPDEDDEGEDDEGGGDVDDAVVEPDETSNLALLSSTVKTQARAEELAESKELAAMLKEAQAEREGLLAAAIGSKVARKQAGGIM